MTADFQPEFDILPPSQRSLSAGRCRCAASAVMLLLVACGSSRPPEPNITADTKPASHNKIMVGSALGRKMIKYVRPVYPKEARKAHVQGAVRLRVFIMKTGEIGEIQVLSGDPVLVPAAISAVKQWRYSPSYLNNEPMAVWSTIDVPFTLNQ